MERTGELVFLGPDDYFTLGLEQFGVPGLTAREIIGPFVPVRASGPMIMIHDGRWEPRHGIGHHPHRFNERLFYILEGEVTHDDALNDIKGHMGTGDLGALTEGYRGMLHKEWNDTDGPARAFILVYGTDPVPPKASFAPLRDADAPRYDEADGVRTKELVGEKSPLEIHGEVRLFTDAEVDEGAAVTLDLEGGEGGLLYVVEGAFEVEGRTLEPEHTVLVSPEGPRSLAATARSDGRVLRVAHGAGDGIVFE